MLIGTWYLSPVDVGFCAVWLKLRLMCRLAALCRSPVYLSLNCMLSV